jgi:hypothetical protein
MRRSAIHLLPALALVASCGTAPSAGDGTAGAHRKKESAGKNRRLDPAWQPGSTPVGQEGEGDEAMAVENARGTLEQRDVEAVLGRHGKALVGCYAEAGPAQRFASGEVGLRFFVSSDGEVSNVLVVKSAVGNFAVERCLVGEGRRIRFPPPRGGKAADFDYSLQFRAGGEGEVVDRSPDMLGRDAAQLASSLAGCGALGPEPVRAVVYIQPGGTVASVGLASPGPLDTVASTCAVQQIRKWRLPGDRKRMVRASFEIASPSEEAAAPAPRLVRRLARRAR